ncbi:MAG: hypothetical protein QN122_12450 [Armatimonadota bacterium]|nr:hypothetical protein [Armatimonadota bacterium]
MTDVMVEAADRLPAVLDLRTGELIDPRDLPRVVEVVEALRQLRAAAQEQIQLATDILRAEAERLGSKTLRVGEWEVEIRGGQETEWDVEALQSLADLGLPEERLAALLRPTLVYRVDGRVARQLAAANPEYGAVIEAARRVVPKPLYLAIRRRP